MRAVWFLLLIGIAGGAWSLWNRDRAPELKPGDPRLETGDQRIVMLAAEWCGYCRKQQRDFERANVRYRVFDVDTPEGDRAAQALGTHSVPVTIIGQHVVRGYNTAQLQEKLTPLGYRVY
ncbi:glutaredoxin [Luteimonas cucumeris]|uniref:Glutaredoxin n=1 Tax=Luteimonas cucumeris TaxID=985012 RepID=A0A562KZU2_9GAMM|nr:glutaredoxin family protein [Luteimonas cucumeris]TWI00921.1 glutaredoxin [Luteimonas cucumeris]